MAGFFVAAEVVHDHDVAQSQRRCQELLDPGEEAFTIDRTIEHAWSGEAVTAQGGDECEGLAWPMRDLRDQSLTSRTTAMQAGHVGLRPGLIDEHQPRGRDFALSLFPLPAPAGHVGAIRFAGAQAFF